MYHKNFILKSYVKLCSVIWLVIGPITIWNCDWWVIEITIFDQWLVSDWNHHFSWSCKYLVMEMVMFIDMFMQKLQLSFLYVAEYSQKHEQKIQPTKQQKATIDPQKF